MLEDTIEAEQRYYSLLLDQNADIYERLDVADRLFDLSMQDNQLNHALQLMEHIMDIQQSKLTNLPLFPQYNQLVDGMESGYGKTLKRLRTADELAAFREKYFPHHRLLLIFSICRNLVFPTLRKKINQLIIFGESIQPILQEQFNRNKK